jgi:hypothetical protein
MEQAAFCDDGEIVTDSAGSRLLLSGDSLELRALMKCHWSRSETRLLRKQGTLAGGPGRIPPQVSADRCFERSCPRSG